MYSLHWTLGVTSITRPEKSIHTDQWEHGYSTDHGAQLHYCSTPHEGTVAFIPQDHPYDDLHVGQGQDKQDPGQHLQHRSVSNASGNCPSLSSTC